MALIRAGGDVTKYWHRRALHTLGFVCVEDMSISHRSIEMAFFAVFALCDYRREKRRRDTDSVIPLKGLPLLLLFHLSIFFLVNRDPYGKIEKTTFMGPVKFPINRILIHLGPNPRRRNQYMHSSQWS